MSILVHPARRSTTGADGGHRALGDRAEVHLDGGTMNGGIVTGAAFGARTCPVGRACRTGSRPVVNGG